MMWAPGSGGRGMRARSCGSITHARPEARITLTMPAASLARWRTAVAEIGLVPTAPNGNSDRGESGLGQSETNDTTEPWSAVEWIADADLTRASFYWDSVPHCRNPPSACPVRGQQFHA